MASVSRIGQNACDMPREAGRAPPPARPGPDLFAKHDMRGDPEQARSLSRLIECEIIPRLLVAHGGGRQAAPEAPRDDAITAADVEAFAPLALRVEADELLVHVDALVARGVSVDTLMVDLLAPTARLLGQFWEDDRCDFVDVTMGLWRLQEVVHDLSARVPTERHGWRQERCALFASMPGDQHSFGTVVLDELFVRAGWTTDRICDATTPQLVERVRGEWFDLVGLTISRDCHIASLSSLIRALRDASCNSGMCVMVGGRVFVGNAALADAVGADATAPDARAAVEVAGALVDRAMRGAMALAHG